MVAAVVLGLCRAARPGYGGARAHLQALQSEQRDQAVREPVRRVAAPGAPRDVLRARAMGFDSFQQVTILNHLSEPFTMALVLLAAGCALTWSGREHRAGRVLTLCATALLLLVAYDVPFNLLA